MVSDQSIITIVCPPFFSLGRIRVEVEIDYKIYTTFLFIVDPETLPENSRFFVESESNINTGNTDICTKLKISVI